MKTLRVITIVFFINVLTVAVCSAQRLVPGSQARGEFTVFNIKSISADSMMVTDDANPYVEETAKLTTYPQSLFARRHGEIAHAFEGSLGDDRIKQLLPELSIAVTFYIKADGKVAEVAYYLRKNTELTAVDLERLTLQIQREARYDRRSKKPIKDELYLVTRKISYHDILDFKVD